MTRFLATCAVLAAIAVPVMAQPFAADDIVEARASASAGKSASVSKIKCRYVNGVLVCSF